MEKHLAITGGAGFIGSNLVDYVNTVSPETRITVIDDLSTGLRENLRHSVCDLRVISILDSDAVRDAFTGVNSVIHLAAIGSVPRSIDFPLDTHQANVTGTVNVLEAARSSGVEQIIVASSSSVYGANVSLPKRELSWTRPLNPYAASKLAAESYALAYSNVYDLSAVAFRFFNVYGPRQRPDHQYAAVIPKFFEAARTNGTITIHGDGSQSRDFTFVQNVCEVLTRASLEGSDIANPVNLAFGTRISILDLKEMIERIVGRTIHTVFTNPRPGDVSASTADSKLLRSHFGAIAPIDIETGLRKTWEAIAPYGAASDRGSEN